MLSLAPVWGDGWVAVYFYKLHKAFKKTYGFTRKMRNIEFLNEKLQNIVEPVYSVTRPKQPGPHFQES